MIIHLGPEKMPPKTLCSICGIDAMLIKYNIDDTTYAHVCVSCHRQMHRYENVTWTMDYGVGYVNQNMTVRILNESDSSNSSNLSQEP